MLLTYSDTKRTLMQIYSCLQIPPKENWVQCVRRVYTTAINFPCIKPLVTSVSLFQKQRRKFPTLVSLENNDDISHIFKSDKCLMETV